MARGDSPSSFLRCINVRARKGRGRLLPAAPATLFKREACVMHNEHRTFRAVELRAESARGDNLVVVVIPYDTGERDR